VLTEYAQLTLKNASLYLTALLDMRDATTALADPPRTSVRLLIPALRKDPSDVKTAPALNQINPASTFQAALSSPLSNAPIWVSVLTNRSNALSMKIPSQELMGVIEMHLLGV
jgi:hypothetical protein